MKKYAHIYQVAEHFLWVDRGRMGYRDGFSASCPSTAGVMPSRVALHLGLEGARCSRKSVPPMSSLRRGGAPLPSHAAPRRRKRCRTGDRLGGPRPVPATFIGWSPHYHARLGAARRDQGWVACRIRTSTSLASPKSEPLIFLARRGGPSARLKSFTMARTSPAAAIQDSR